MFFLKIHLFFPLLLYDFRFWAKLKRPNTAEPTGVKEESVMTKARFWIAGAAVTIAAASLCAAIAAPPAPVAVVAAVSPTPAATGQPTYLLLDHQGELCVFSDGQLIQRTGIPVSALPAADRERLIQGIPAESRQQLYTLLEDLAS